MARAISARLRLQGTLVATTPLHVGGFGEDVDTDLPLARNGRGEWYVPGTSLAGPFRHWCERRFGNEFVRRLWGFQEGEEGHASYVIVEDAAVENADSVLDEIRDHVGIDRKWGCAAEHIKFDRAILPRGTRLRLSLIMEVGEDLDHKRALAVLAHLKNALEAEEIRLGAAKTRGLGRVRLENAEVRRWIFNERNGILEALEKTDGSPVSLDELQTACQNYSPHPAQISTITIDWEPVGPLMVKAGYEGVAADMIPLVSGVNGQVALVLPGSSIKGSLRSHAERIVRTLLDKDFKDVSDAKQRFLSQVELPLINELFGMRGQQQTKQNDHQDCLPGQGALAVDDCYGRNRLRREQWQAIETAQTDLEMRQALDSAMLKAWQEAYHVAVDRWLGSSAESMLYTVLEPHRANWEPIRLTLDFQRLPSNERLPAVALLLLILRDLAQDRIPLGFATHRGMGSIRVINVRFAISTTDSTLAKLAQVRIENGQLISVPEEIKQAWRQWSQETQSAKTSSQGANT